MTHVVSGDTFGIWQGSASSLRKYAQDSMLFMVVRHDGMCAGSGHNLLCMCFVRDVVHRA